MSRKTPDRAHAAGMLEAIVNTHTCTNACTGTVNIGKESGAPKTVRLRCPWEQIDLDNPADRRIIAGAYASEARAAMGRQA